MFPREPSDKRDAGRGHLIDGLEPYYDKADEMRKLAREDASTQEDSPPQEEGTK